jgi:hypothetical protein
VEYLGIDWAYPPAVNLRPERDHPDCYLLVITGARIRPVLLRIAADIEGSPAGGASRT